MGQFSDALSGYDTQGKGNATPYNQPGNNEVNSDGTQSYLTIVKGSGKTHHVMNKKTARITFSGSKAEARAHIAAMRK